MILTLVHLSAWAPQGGRWDSQIYAWTCINRTESINCQNKKKIFVDFFGGKILKTSTLILIKMIFYGDCTWEDDIWMITILCVCLSYEISCWLYNSCNSRMHFLFVCSSFHFTMVNEIKPFPFSQETRHGFDTQL